MREDLLHFIWKYHKIPHSGLHTVKGSPLQIVALGQHNQHSGPDFFNARIRIGDQEWAGNVEIHLKASDWYAHGHESDPHYGNVILHVVWEYDMEVFRPAGDPIPTLELRDIIPKSLLERYYRLMDQADKKFVNCDRALVESDAVLVRNWLDRLYFERLEAKSVQIVQLLESTQYDWERVLFLMLFKGFGSKVNGEAFLQLAKGLPWGQLKKIRDPQLLEALFMGQAGLLLDPILFDPYYSSLQREYTFLCKKHGLSPPDRPRLAFFKLRPHNFPTIRLSQLAVLYASTPQLFSQLMEITSLEEGYALLQPTASRYWDDHYVFGKCTPGKSKRLSKGFVDLLVINTVLPLLFCYGKYRGRFQSDRIISLIQSIPAETNGVVRGFRGMGLEVPTAMDSQALLQLFGNYCERNRCLHCAIGAKLLGR